MDSGTTSESKMSVGGDRAVRAGKATRILTGRRMIAATVLRELRLLGVINIAIREEWQGRQRL